jgi:hypothetical protein
MSSGDAVLKLLLVGEDKSASEALGKVGDHAKTTGDKIKKEIGGSSTEAGGHLGKIKDIAAGVFTADMAKEAGKAIVDFGKGSIEAYRDAAASQRKLDDAFERFPALAGANADGLRSLNDALQSKTGADADDLAAGQATLAQYGLNADQLQQMTPLLVDYATKTGKDVASAAEDLGKSMLGQGRALKDVGIDFNDTGSVAGNFQQVMGGLGDKVGGFAEKEATTLDGKMQILQVKFGDVQEAIGQRLLPVITDLADKGMKVIDWATRNSDVLIPLVTILGSVVGIIGIVIGATKVWTAIQLVWNAVMSANPVALIIIGIAALAAGLIYAYQHSETFRDIVDGAFKAIGDAGKWLWEHALKPAFDATVLGFQAIGIAGTWLWNNALEPVLKLMALGFMAVLKWVGDLLSALGNVPGFGWAKDAADKMHAAADKAKEMADGIKKIPDKTVDITMQVTANYDAKAQAALSVARGNTKLSLPGFASGGRPEVGRLAMFGENGAELWIPDQPGTVINASQTAAMMSGPSALGGLGGGGNTYVNITVAGDSDPNGAAKRIEEKLRMLSQSRGNRPLAFQV